MFYVYVLQLSNNKSYIGYTNDLQRRIKEHTNGESRYTKNYRPIQLVYYEAYQSKKDAQERELKLKQFKNSYSHLKRRIKRSIDKI